MSYVSYEPLGDCFPFFKSPLAVAELRVVEVLGLVLRDPSLFFGFLFGDDIWPLILFFITRYLLMLLIPIPLLFVSSYY